MWNMRNKHKRGTRGLGVKGSSEGIKIIKLSNPGILEALPAGRQA
jgi:hypothetical protein